MVWCLNPILLKSANLTIAVFPQAGFWQWKMSVFSSSVWGSVCVCACARECLWQYIAIAAYCGIKAIRTEFVQIASSLLLLCLINSRRWLDGSLHTVFGGQSSSPYQLAITTAPKTDRNTTAYIDLHADIPCDSDTYIPPYQTDGKESSAATWLGKESVDLWLTGC